MLSIRHLIPLSISSNCQPGHSLSTTPLESVPADAVVTRQLRLVVII